MRCCSRRYGRRLCHPLRVACLTLQRVIVRRASPCRQHPSIPGRCRLFPFLAGKYLSGVVYPRDDLKCTQLSSVMQLLETQRNKETCAGGFRGEVSFPERHQSKAPTPRHLYKTMNLFPGVVTLWVFKRQCHIYKRNQFVHSFPVDFIYSIHAAVKRKQAHLSAHSHGHARQEAVWRSRRGRPRRQQTARRLCLS